MGGDDMMYVGKVLLAPMVRVTSLPFRRVAADHGADVLFTEELIAQKLIKTERRVDEARGMVEYFLTEQNGKLKKKQLLQTLVFSTLVRKDRTEHPEGAPLVLQLGSSNPEAAAAAAKHVEQDVDGIDLNMGCPKDFSLKGGMGAALLSTPDLACSILKAMSEAVSVPVTAKVRLLHDKEDMVALLRNLATTGIKAVTLHARYKESRYESGPFIDYLDEVLAELPGYPLPLVYNGNVTQRDGCFGVPGAQLAGMRGVMIARGALQNPTCFSASPLSKIAAYTLYLKSCLRYKGGMRDVKYTLSRSFQEHKEYTEVHGRIQKAKSIPEMWEALGNDLQDAEFQELLKGHVEPMLLVPGLITEYNEEREKREGPKQAQRFANAVVETKAEKKRAREEEEAAAAPGGEAPSKRQRGDAVEAPEVPQVESPSKSRSSCTLQ
eukprot:TRINITY_DN45602_c0_g1_i1.p1 TRINITY_DN45602_c0_g1~~TRINITY_DN45602_c0_g1_i1.p1  ORF type:complete len:460 (+),score=211.53 TRINITY_DN45602_c0_g1_i1:70-1380(+)